jgi:hypothetical protein
MSQDWELPRVRNQNKLRRGDSPILAATPEPLRHQTTAELRGLLASEAAAWGDAAARLGGAGRWFRSHSTRDPKWNECAVRAGMLTSAAFRARLSGGHALFAYVARCQALDEADLRRETALWPWCSPFDAYDMWTTIFPCPRAMDTVAQLVKGWRPWWEDRLGRDPPPCLADPTTCWADCLRLRRHELAAAGRDENETERMSLEGT